MASALEDALALAVSKDPVPSNSKNSVISSSVKLTITDACLAFGDVEDIFQDEVIQSDGGTISYTINVRRKFMKGDYIMHIVETKPKERFGAEYAAILCREDVDPLKIHDLLKDSNFGYDFRCKNFISRYDWKHFRNWKSFKCEEEDSDEYDSESSTDEEFDNDSDCDVSLWDEIFNRDSVLAVLASEAYELFLAQLTAPLPPPLPKVKKVKPLAIKPAAELTTDEIKLQFKDILLEYFQNDTATVRHSTFFINSDKMLEISNGDFSIEKENDWIYLIYDKTIVDNKKSLLGFFLKETEDPGNYPGPRLISGDWHYGAILHDTKTKQGFAFVFGDAYENHDLSFGVNVEETDYTYDIRDFLRSGPPLLGANVYAYEGHVERELREERRRSNIMEQYIRQATATNVIVLKGEVWRHSAFNRIRNDDGWETDRTVMGPTCSLCDKVISSDVFSFVYKDIRYTVLFEKMIMAFKQGKYGFEMCLHQGGELQCCYCFRYFHRRNCTLSMSDSAYMSFKISKTWTCPSCIPSEFCYSAIKRKREDSDKNSVSENKKSKTYKDD